MRVQLCQSLPLALGSWVPTSALVMAVAWRPRCTRTSRFIHREHNVLVTVQVLCTA